MKEQTLMIQSNYLNILLDTATEFRISKQDLINKSQLPSSFFHEQRVPEKIKFSEWIKIISSLLELAPDTGIGYRFGLNCRVTSHETLGFAMLSNDTLGNVILDLQKYFNIRLHKMELNIHNHNDKVIITVHPLYQLPKDMEIEKREAIIQFLTEAAIVNIITNLKEITEYEITGMQVQVMWGKNHYHSGFEKRLPSFKFNQEKNQIIFDLKCMDLPLKFSSKSAYIFAIHHVEEEYLISQDQENQIVSLVNKNIKLVPHEGFPTLTDTAKKLRVSERVLKRELMLANTTFSTLIQTKKFALTKQLISSNKSIQEISDILGYSHINAFSRAFRGWTGKNPRDYIREQKTGSGYIRPLH
ncbi:helix-turn-helix domain-containing protein [Acinetobacter calcoaceticus]|uniref:AraC family transcriptional regulator n=1 Tax=Acinetobacter calcoaceticus TaxID=471 RepID=UPI002B311D1E|nr:helix-turn-helix domain-containing protein [Acinetobacter baumannii]